MSRLLPVVFRGHHSPLCLLRNQQRLLRWWRDFKNTRVRPFSLMHALPRDCFTFCYIGIFSLSLFFWVPPCSAAIRSTIICSLRPIPTPPPPSLSLSLFLPFESCKKERERSLLLLCGQSGRALEEEEEEEGEAATTSTSTTVCALRALSPTYADQKLRCTYVLGWGRTSNGQAISRL